MKGFLELALRVSGCFVTVIGEGMQVNEQRGGVIVLALERHIVALASLCSRVVAMDAAFVEPA